MLPSPPTAKRFIEVYITSYETLDCISYTDAHTHANIQALVVKKLYAAGATKEDLAKPCTLHWTADKSDRTRVVLEIPPC